MMSGIFPSEIKIEDLQKFCKDTMISHLGIEFIDVSETKLKAKMPVDHRTVQPMRLLHGGASAALAESVGSLASALLVDKHKQHIVGTELSISHLKSAKKGFVFCEAIPFHIGKTSHVWDLKVIDEASKIISVCRLTVRVLDLKK